MERRYIIGIDIGGTNFRIGAAGRDPFSCRIHFRKVPIGEVFRSKFPIEDLKTYLSRYMQDLRKEGKRPEAVCIGFPATLDQERRVVLQAPNIPFMENLPVADELEKTLGISVKIERDVCLSLIFDKEKYGLSDRGIICGIYFGTGIGNAIMIDGKLLLGKDGAAGEIGHIPVDGSREMCGCGKMGCMENLAGGKYLAKLCRERYVHTPVQEMFVRHAKDPELQQFIERMAMTAATEINILNPDYMVLGGGVINMAEFPRELLRERILFHTRRPYPAQGLNLLFAEDEKDKAVVGAALYARINLGW